MFNCRHDSYSIAGPEEYSDDNWSDDSSSVVASELINCELTTSFEWKNDSDVSNKIMCHSIEINIYLFPLYRLYNYLVPGFRIRLVLYYNLLLYNILYTIIIL